MAIVKYSVAEMEVSPKTPEWVKKAEEPEPKQEEVDANEDDSKEVR